MESSSIIFFSFHFFEIKFQIASNDVFKDELFLTRHAAPLRPVDEVEVVGLSAQVGSEVTGAQRNER